MEINTARSRKASYFNYKGRKAIAQASEKNQIRCAACFFRSPYRRARSAALRFAARHVAGAGCLLDTEVALGEIGNRLQTKRLNVYDICRGLRAEYQTYRRGEDGKLPEGFGLIRGAGMVVVNGLNVAVSENKAVADEEAEHDGPRPIGSSTTGY
jgi:hypothetical protein